MYNEIVHLKDKRSVSCFTHANFKTDLSTTYETFNNKKIIIIFMLYVGEC